MSFTPGSHPGHITLSHHVTVSSSWLWQFPEPSLFYMTWQFWRILVRYLIEYSLEGLMLKLKLQYFGNLMWRTDSLEKSLMLGKIEGRRRREHRGWDAWMASPTRWTWVWRSSRIWWWTGKPRGLLQSIGSQSCTGLRDCTELKWWVNLSWSPSCLTERIMIYGQYKYLVYTGDKILLRVV